MSDSLSRLLSLKGAQAIQAFRDCIKPEPFAEECEAFYFEPEALEHLNKEFKKVAEYYLTEYEARRMIETIKYAKLFADDLFTLKALPEIVNIPKSFAMMFKARRSTIKELAALLDEDTGKALKTLQGLLEEFLTRFPAAKAARITAKRSTAAHTEDLKNVTEHVSEDSINLIVETIGLFAKDPFTLKALPELVNIPNLSAILHAERENIERRLNALVDGDNSKVFEVLQSLSRSTQSAAASTWSEVISSSVSYSVKIASHVANASVLGAKNLVSGASDAWKTWLLEAPRFIACESVKPALTYISTSSLGNDICAAMTAKNISAPSVLYYSDEFNPDYFKIAGGLVATKLVVSALAGGISPMVPVGLTLLALLPSAYALHAPVSEPVILPPSPELLEQLRGLLLNPPTTQELLELLRELPFPGSLPRPISEEQTQLIKLLEELWELVRSQLIPPAEPGEVTQFLSTVVAGVGGHNSLEVQALITSPSPGIALPPQGKLKQSLLTLIVNDFGSRMVMHVPQYVDKVLHPYIMFNVAGVSFGMAALHDYIMLPDETSLVPYLGYGATCVGIVGLFFFQPLATAGIGASYIGLSIGSSYASYLGYSNSMAMVLQPALAVDHAEKHASPPVIALLGRSLNKNVEQLRDEARTLVTSLSSDDSCWPLNYIPFVGGSCRSMQVMGNLYESWASELANDINGTVIDAIKTDKTLLLSDKETYFNATHAMVNCKDYSQAEALLKSIGREQISFTGRLWLSMVDAVEGIYSLFFGSTSELSELCYDFVGFLSRFLTLKGVQAIQAVLDFKKPDGIAKEFRIFHLSFEARKHFIKEVEDVVKHVNEDTASLIVEIIKMFATQGKTYAPHVIAELAKIPNLVLNAERRTIEGQLTDLIDECDSEVFEALQGLPEEFLTHARAARSAGIGATQSTAAHTEELEDIDTHASEEAADLIVETIKLFANDPFTLKALPELVNIPNLSAVLHAERANIERRLNALVDGDNSKVFEVLQSLSRSTQWNFSLPSLAKWSCELKEAGTFFSDACVTEVHSFYNKFKADSVICACTKGDNATLTAFINLKDDGSVVELNSTICEKIASANEVHSLSIPDTYVEHELPACSGEVSHDLHVYVKSVS